VGTVQHAPVRVQRPGLTSACRRRLTAYAPLQLPAAPDAWRWAPRAREKNQDASQSGDPTPPKWGSLHAWEPHPTRDGAPPSREGSPQRGGFLPRPGRAGAAGPAKPGAWAAFPCRGRRALAGLPWLRAAACTWVGPCGRASQGPAQAEHTGPGAQRWGSGSPQQLRRCPVLRGTEADGSGQAVGAQGVGACSGGRLWGEEGGVSRRTSVPEPAPNKRLHLTPGSGVRWLGAVSVAPAQVKCGVRWLRHSGS